MPVWGMILLSSAKNFLMKIGLYRIYLMITDTMFADIRVAKQIRHTLSLVLMALIGLVHPLYIQSATCDDFKGIAERLQRGVDNPDAEKNKYRGGVDNIQAVIENMKKIAKPILPGSPNAETDKWYSPHLRDTKIAEKEKQAELRGNAGAAVFIQCPFKPDEWMCWNGLGGRQTACPLCQKGGWCGNIPWPEGHESHLALECCAWENNGTAIYHRFIEDTNFKTCCVRDGTNPGDLNETFMSEERIACRHPDGSGWAGLFEYYYPTTIIGVENQRGETMLATKEEVSSCIQAADAAMESKGVDWVADAIQRNLKVAAGTDGGEVSADPKKIKEQIREDISEVRPRDAKLRLSDSLQGEGLTARPFLPAYDRPEMEKLARHFCMRPTQFYKLMDPRYDKLQLIGGTSSTELAKIPPWTNYCAEGVELMTNPENTSKLINRDESGTDFIAGMKAWKNDPLYCQSMSLTNPNMDKTRIGDVIRKSSNTGALSEQQVGYTCSGTGELNNGLVPVTLYRNAPVERRAAFADHAMAFLITTGLATMEPGEFSLKSIYKRFEPRPYSKTAVTGYQTFWGKKFSGGGINEIGMQCGAVNGENYSIDDKKGNSDQLFLSDYTHKSFTQQPVVNKNGDDKAFKRYIQQWSKGDQKSEKDMKIKRLDADKQNDKDVHNYAVSFRIFATCPSGYSRWRPDASHGALAENIVTQCGEENFGSPKVH